MIKKKVKTCDKKKTESKTIKKRKPINKLIWIFCISLIIFVILLLSYKLYKRNNLELKITQTQIDKIEEIQSQIEKNINLTNIEIQKNGKQKIKIPKKMILNNIDKNITNNS
jgi:sensor domain CHASE-containing protein